MCRPAADTAVLSPDGYPAGDQESRVEGQPGQDPVPVVPECLDAGFLPRVATADVRRGSGSGFASGDVLDTALPGPALAGFAGYDPLARPLGIRSWMMMS